LLYVTSLYKDLKKKIVVLLEIINFKKRRNTSLQYETKEKVLKL